MSRVILSKHPDGSEHVTVGWDHPCQGAFWQEWATEEEVAAAEVALREWEGDPAADVDYCQLESIAETGVKQEDGMFPGLPLDELRGSMPPELRPLVTDAVLDLLREHAENPDSGFFAPIDLTEKAGRS
jgi:hypothetical protein